MPECGPNWWGNLGILGGSLVLLYWIIIVAIIVIVVRFLRGRSSYSMKTPMDILKERYAKGEIDKKEFEEKRRDLTS